MTRRFINEDRYEGDISNPLTLNLYTYVHNNPLKYIDPSGNIAVNSTVWDLNIQLNDLNITWAKENAVGNIEARDAAAAEAAKLRADFYAMAEGLDSPLATQGLLEADDGILAYHDIVDEETGQIMTIAIDGYGKV